MADRTLSSTVLSSTAWGVVACALVAGSCATTRAPGTAEMGIEESGMSSSVWNETPWQSSERLTHVCLAAIERAMALGEQVKAAAAPRTIGGTVESTLEPFNQMLVALDDAGGLAALMFQVHPDEGVRQAAQECQQKVADLETRIYLDRQLYDALAGVDPASTEGQSRRALERLLRDFRRSGVDRDEATRKRLAELNSEMVKLGQEYQQNVRNDVRTVRVDPRALAGLPRDFVEAHPVDGDGKVALTTDYPDFIPFQTYSADGVARRELYLAFLGRAWPANTEHLRGLLQRRKEYAALLGYPNWADYFAADKMVKSGARIEAFIAELVEAAKPAMERDTSLLLELKRRDDPTAEAIEMWDRFYYVSKAREEKHAFDARAVRPYFPYERVKQGILDLYAELFGLRFVPLPDADVWHPSVDAYALYSGERLIGRFYLDMHPREGKFKHAAMFPVRTGLSTGRIPVASLVCNFPDPLTGDGHALMEHGDVVTYFHEFGHLIHHLLASGTAWMPLSGLSVEWDFVETPSQLLEEWAWDARVLQRFAVHVETGEPIAAELVAKMRAAEELGKGLHLMRQLYYTAFSYFLHLEDPETVDLEEFTLRVGTPYSPFPIPAATHLYANFGHLVGYTSAYYTYQWSLVIAKDLFGRFENEGLLNPAVAAEYRRTILEPGATKDAADLVRDFLGRPYTIDAYREWLLRE